MKRSWRICLRVALFFVVFALLFSQVQTLVARKTLTEPWNMTVKIGGFFNEPKDSFDVMFFGSSHSYATFSPLRLWENTGVKSYVLATQQQPMWATYTYLKQALKRQSLTLAVLDCDMALGDVDYYDDGVNYPYMDDLPFSWDKVQLARVSAPTLEGQAQLLCNIAKYHTRWNELTKADFTFRRSALRDPYKGSVFLQPQPEAQPRPDISGVDARTPLTEKNAYWLRQIIHLCQDEGVSLWLMKSPSNVNAEEKAKLNTIADIAAEAGVCFHDFNEDYDAIGLSSDLFYDQHHLDALGSAQFTDYFSTLLIAAYPDLATSPDDSAWQQDAAAYEARLSALAAS